MWDLVGLWGVWFGICGENAVPLLRRMVMWCGVESAVVSFGLYFLLCSLRRQERGLHPSLPDSPLAGDESQGDGRASPLAPVLWYWGDTTWE